MKDLRPARQDLMACGGLLIISLLVGFFYHAWTWKGFWDLFRAHTDTQLYYAPLACMGQGLTDVLDLPVRYSIFQMPKGYYYLINSLNHVVSLIVLSKVIPILISAGTVCLFYRLMRSFGDGVFAFTSTLIFCFHAWTFHVYQALCPRAFFYPLLIAFLYCYQQKKPLLCCSIFVAQAIFYPPAAAISLGTVLVMKMCSFSSGQMIRRRVGRTMAIFLIGAGALIGLHQVQYPRANELEFGPLITQSHMRALPEFYPQGKESFFFEFSQWDQWLMSKRAGLGMNAPLACLILCCIIFWFLIKKDSSRERLPGLFKAVALSSLGLFVVAYLCLFWLYYPARYVMYTMPMLFAVLLGWQVSVFVRQTKEQIFRIGFLIMVSGLIVVGYGGFLVGSRTDSNRGGLIDNGYLRGVISFLKNKQVEGAVAAPPYVADPLPLYACQKVLFSDRLLIPFQEGYYRIMRKRVEDFYAAYYSTSAQTIKQFCIKHKVAYLVIDLSDFRQGGQKWPSKRHGAYVHFIPSNVNPAGCVLPNIVGQARVYDDGNYVIIDARKL